MTNEQTTFSSRFLGEKKGSLRAMFYNVFGYRWWQDKERQPHLNSGPVSLRQQMQTELIQSYAPDVLGMQEYSKAYHQRMTPLLSNAGYREVNVCHTKCHKDGVKINYTVLFYRPDTLKLIDKGFVMYPEVMPDPAKDDGSVLNINDVSSKSLTWAVFEELKTQKRFLAVCTHFMYNAAWLTPEQSNAARVQNAKLLLDTVAAIRRDTSYLHLPVLIGGDLNCRYGSEPFCTLQKGGMEWLYDLAPIKDNSKGTKPYAVYDETKGEYISYRPPVEDPRGAIDYIWRMPASTGGTEMEIVSYVTVTDRLALLSSDHCPRFTDFTLNETERN